jgi:hypothetical protein
MYVAVSRVSLDRNGDEWGQENGENKMEYDNGQD